MRKRLGKREYNFGFGEKTLASSKELFEDVTDAERLGYQEPATHVEGGVGAFDLIWDDQAKARQHRKYTPASQRACSRTRIELR